MRTNRLRHSGRLTLQVGVALVACHAAGASLESQWRASSGLLPDQACPPWSLTDSATPEDPVLGGGHLTISTSAAAETMAYGHSGLTLQIPDPLIVEFRARFVSGSQSIDSRAPLTVHPGAPETCDGMDNDCDALTDDALAPPPGVVHGLRVAADAASITWDLCEARRYDVVRGSLGALRTSAGNFATAVSLCVEDDSPDSAASDPTPVPAGTTGFFYLVRGDGTCGPGSYDNGLPSQIGSRDAEIAASGADCP